MRRNHIFNKRYSCILRWLNFLIVHWWVNAENDIFPVNWVVVYHGNGHEKISSIGQHFHSETFPRQTSVLTYKYSIDNPTIMMLMSLEKLSKVRKLMFCATRSGHLYSYQIRTSLKFLQYKQINFEFVWPTSLVLNMGYARQIISMRETVFTRVKLLIKHL